MLNSIWCGMVLIALLYSAFTDQLKAVGAAVFEAAPAAVDLVIDLVGPMIFFLGLMRVALDGGLLRWIVGALGPLLRRLFPGVPPEHPAMGAIVMNLASNILGLGNSATPFGLKAMAELERINPVRGVASDPMILFLAINTTSITLLPPLGTISVRAAAGSQDPFAIWVPTLIATSCSTLAAVTAFYLLRRLPRFAARPLSGAEIAQTPSGPEPSAEIDAPLGAAQPTPPTPLRRVLIAVSAGALALAFCLQAGAQFTSQPPLAALQALLEVWLLPLLIAALLLVGFRAGVPIYESMIEGGKEGLAVALRILPFLVAILTAVAMFRASGALGLLVGLLDPLTSAIGIPAEALPMALLRPLSGSGSFGLMAEILETHGPDSFVGRLVCTLMGSTDTTFYVLTLYAGAAGLRDLRHALWACLIGDVAGLLGATAACHLFFG